MKASNIGVVFGPTLMRPERESVAAIVDIKYQNIIVEMMIVERERVRLAVGGGGYGCEGEAGCREGVGVIVERERVRLAVGRVRANTVA